MLIDSHCHLNHKNIAELGDAQSISDMAKAQNVAGMTSICCEIATEFDALLAAVKPLQNVWCSVGTHPHDASKETEKAVTLEQIVKLAHSDPKVIGIGESGLDYYYDFADRNDQQESFRKHIQACMETGLPLIVHARDADRDCIDIIKEEVKNGPKPLTGVMHCFSSSEQMAMEALDIGFYISFSGMITFKNMQWLRDIAAKMPVDRILVETDSPYLAPMPYRGKTNQPAYVAYTAQELAKIHGVSEQEIATITTENFFRLFPKALETWIEPEQGI